MSTYKGAFSSDDLSGSLGDKQDWHGAGYNIRTNLAPDRSRPRRNFSDGAIDRVWDVSRPRTAGPATGAPFAEIHTRGDCAFSSSDMGALGKPTKPGKP
jgi:hypothetical protein